MILRALTADEAAQIKKAKQDANQILKERIKKLRKHSYRRVQEHDSIRNITGSPVTLTMEGGSMLIDYALLKKFDRMLDPRKWQRSVRMQSVMGKTILTIQYEKNKQSGLLELYELPAYQTELLKDLPVVEVTEWF